MKNIYLQCNILAPLNTKPCLCLIGTSSNCMNFCSHFLLFDGLLFVNGRTTANDTSGRSINNDRAPLYVKTASISLQTALGMGRDNLCREDKTLSVLHALTQNPFSYIKDITRERERKEVFKPHTNAKGCCDVM